MVFDTFKITATGLTPSTGIPSVLTVPVSFRSKFNQIFIKYATLAATWSDGAVSKYIASDMLIKNIISHTSNLQVGTITGVGVGGVPVFGSEEVDAIAVPQNVIMTTPLPINSDFEIIILMNVNVTMAAADDFVFYLTLGYDV